MSSAEVREVQWLSVSGVCWYCGCTPTEACVDPHRGEPCRWVDGAQDFCSVCALMFGAMVFGEDDAFMVRRFGNFAVLALITAEDELEFAGGLLW